MNYKTRPALAGFIKDMIADAVCDHPGGNIPDIETEHQLDVLFESASGKKRSIEMKNWSVARSITGTTYDQFKQYVTSGNDFIYYFSDAAKAGMKEKFQELFTAKANEWFSGGIDPAKLKIAFGTDKKSIFLSKINDISNPIYDFIK